MWLFDIVFKVVWEVQGIPALSALGAALSLLAFASMLNWLFKVAWEERTLNNSNPSNCEDDPAA